MPKLRYTPMANQHFVGAGGMWCPFCGSAKIKKARRKTNLRRMAATRLAKCQSCGGSWQENYQIDYHLVGYTIEQEPKEGW